MVIIWYIILMANKMVRGWLLTSPCFHYKTMDKYLFYFTITTGNMNCFMSSISGALFYFFQFSYSRIYCAFISYPISIFLNFRVGDNFTILEDVFRHWRAAFVVSAGWTSSTLFKYLDMDSFKLGRAGATAIGILYFEAGDKVYSVKVS